MKLKVILIAAVVLAILLFYKTSLSVKVQPSEPFVYAMDIADVKKSDITPQGPPKEYDPEANVDAFVNKFRYPSGYALGECLNKNKSEYVDNRRVLVTDGNGKPIETDVRIAYPRVYGISGHENKPYVYQDFNNYCPCYPEKLQIDQLAGNNFIPRIKDICEC